MASYELSRAADADLERLYTFGILNFGVALADEYYDGLIARLQQITEMPNLYPVITIAKQSYRRSVYGSHSIYYTAKTEGVFVVRVLGRENPATAF